MDLEQQQLHKRSQRSHSRGKRHERRSFLNYTNWMERRPPGMLQFWHTSSLNMIQIEFPRMETIIEFRLRSYNWNTRITWNSCSVPSCLFCSTEGIRLSNPFLIPLLLDQSWWRQGRYGGIRLRNWISFEKLDNYHRNWKLTWMVYFTRDT